MTVEAFRWVLAFHIIAMVAWFAGLFYLPRLFFYHSVSSDKLSIERFKIMEHKLFFFIMTPAGIITTFLGLWLLSSNFSGYLHQSWMHTKLLLVACLWAYHIYCGKLLYDFKNNRNQYMGHFYRWFNEVPTILLILIVIMVIVKPGS
jgi:putative membrane protein